MHLLVQFDYCNSIMYNVPTNKTERFQILQNHHVKLPRGEHYPGLKKKLHWRKIQDRITYKILMLTYKLYYNIAPTYLCELIRRKESSVNTRLENDHHQLIMLPISKNCSNTFLERSFINAAPC